MNGFRAFSTVVIFFANLWLVGSATASPDMGLPPEDEPSFNWARLRFGEVLVKQANGEFQAENAIERWEARPDVRDMWVLVSDVWQQLSYINRYRLVQGLGTIAARKGYTVTVVDDDNRTLATYACSQENGQLMDCQVNFDPTPRL